jgi:methionyl-tRNA formyltransferase
VVSRNPLLIGTGNGLLEIRSLQAEGEAELTSAEFAVRHALENTLLK